MARKHDVQTLLNKISLTDRKLIRLVLKLTKMIQFKCEDRIFTLIRLAIKFVRCVCREISL